MIVTNTLDVGAPFVPDLVASFMQQDETIRRFVDWDPTLAAVHAYADKRVFSQEKRDVLARVLGEQYAGIGGSKQVVLDNIASLADARTFTITT